MVPGAGSARRDEYSSALVGTALGAGRVVREDVLVEGLLESGVVVGAEDSVTVLCCLRGRRSCGSGGRRCDC